MSNDLKSSVLVNFLWKFAERVGSQLVTFIVSIVLAWFIMPDDYSVITLVTIIITLCNLFVVSGFGNSLIQKKDADNTDFSTVFYFSIFFSVAIYGVLFFSAPSAETFFGVPLLCPVIRVMGLRLIISAVNSVQQAYVARTMQFKRFFFSTLGGTVASGILGVYLAYRGFGVWAIVVQYLTTSVVDTLVLWFTVKWRPSLSFSFKRLRSLLSFGWKVLVGAMIDEIYNNMKFFIVGKLYTEAELSVYNNGQRIPNLIVDNVNSSIYTVLFPAFSQNQTDIKKVCAMTRRSIKVCLYIIMPLMIGLAVCSESVVHILLPESWYMCIPFIQLSSLAFSIIPLQTANMQSIKAIGRSDVTLKTEIVKKVIGFGVLFAVMRKGTMTIAISTVATSFLFALINTIPNKIYLKYRFRDQLWDVLPTVLMSAVMGTCVWFVGKVPLSSILVLILQVLAGVSVYAVLSIIFKIDSFEFLLEFVMKFFKKEKENAKV